MIDNDRQAKMLERVRALLAKADSTQFPAEAEAFRAKADELMTAYAIEQWQVDAAQGASTARPKPISRHFDMKWYEDNSRKGELWILMQDLAKHCRVRLVYWRYGAGTVPAVGLGSDLDYFDMLFTHMMLQMAKGLEPKPDPEKPMIENLAVLKEAGLKWARVAELLHGVGQLPEPQGDAWIKAQNFSGQYTKFCQETGRQRQRTSPSVYQRSYSKGFITEVRTRLRHQEQAQHKTGSMELALRDIKDEVNSAAEDMFGKDPKNYAMEKQSNIDPAAYRVGAADGAKAHISANPNETVRSGRRGALEQ